MYILTGTFMLDDGPDMTSSNFWQAPLGLEMAPKGTQARCDKYLCVGNMQLRRET